MNEIFDLTLKEIGGAAVLIAGLSAWIGAVLKNRIHLKEKNKFDVSLKKLEAEHARQTQALEHSLQIERHSAILGHSKLIEKRVAIIDQNYKLLVDLHDAIFDTIRPDYFGREKPSKEEAYDHALPKFDSFVKHFESNKIYFSESTCKEVSKLYVAAAQTLSQARVAIESGESFEQENTPNLQKLFNKVNYDMGEARKIVEQDFRSILRVGEV